MLNTQLKALLLNWLNNPSDHKLKLFIERGNELYGEQQFTNMLEFFVELGGADLYDAITNNRGQLDLRSIKNG